MVRNRDGRCRAGVKKKPNGSRGPPSLLGSVGQFTWNRCPFRLPFTFAGTAVVGWQDGKGGRSDNRDASMVR